MPTLETGLFFGWEGGAGVGYGGTERETFSSFSVFRIKSN